MSVQRGSSRRRRGPWGCSSPDAAESCHRRGGRRGVGSPLLIPRRRSRRTSEPAFHRVWPRRLFLMTLQIARGNALAANPPPRARHGFGRASLDRPGQGLGNGRCTMKWARFAQALRRTVHIPIGHRPSVVESGSWACPCFTACLFDRHPTGGENFCSGTSEVWGRPSLTSRSDLSPASRLSSRASSRPGARRQRRNLHVRVGTSRRASQVLAHRVECPRLDARPADEIEIPLPEGG